MDKTLIVADVVDWAIAKLCLPLKKTGADLAYHYINTSKGTGTGEKNPTHLKIDLLKKYDQIHFTTCRAVDNMLRNPEVLEVIKGKKLLMTIMTEREDDLQLIKQKHWEIIDQYISPTKYQQQRIKDLIGKDSIYIPFAIDEKKYTFTKDYPRKTDVIGYIGRVTPHKSLDAIVGASEGYSVVGIGYVDNDGQEYWRNMPKGELTMYQQLSEDKKIEIMRSFTVLVSISDPHIETGPLGVLECAALGIPIITTDVGWARDNLKDMESAYIIKKNELGFPLIEGSLREHILTFLEDMKLGKEKCRLGARKIIDNWTLDMYINAHKEVYA